MLYNPAFAGNVDLGRFALSYRNQWPGISGNFKSYSASYDHYFAAANSGMGLQFVNDRAGSGGMTNSSINYMYSYQIRLDRKLALLAGIKGGYHLRYYDFSKFTFADQIARDNAQESVVNDFREQIGFPNIGAGLVFYHAEKYWFGASIDHLNQPSNGFVDTESVLDYKASFQGGYNIDINTGLGGYSNEKITIAALYKAQRQWDQLDLGFYYQSEPLILGLWYRGLPVKDNESSIPNVDALVFLTGYKLNQVSIAYSYDWTISALSGSTAGSHEISVVLELNKPRRRQKRFARVPCPKF